MGETELTSNDLLKDNFMNTKDRYLHFMHELSNILGCTELGNSLGLDLSTMDMLLERAKQLSKGETNVLANKSSNLYILQRKVKDLKESLKNEDMHIDLLRQKLVKVDEQNITKENLYIDRDDAVKTAQKLEKRVFRLENQLGTEKTENLRLKAEVASVRELQIENQALKADLDKRVDQVNRLQLRTGKQNSKLSKLQHNLAMTEADGLDRTGHLSHDLRHVKHDLKVTKASLEETQRQKKSLENFRQVIAKMLGLDVSNLSIPDFEVISRLENLIQNHHIRQTTTTIPVTSVQPNIPVAGYAAQTSRHRSPIPVRSPVRHQITEDTSETPIYDTEPIRSNRFGRSTRRYRSVSPASKRKHRTRY